MIEELAAEREEIGAVRSAADSVEKVTGRLHSESDEIHILLHVVDLGRFPDAEDETRHAEDVAITYQQTRWLARIYLIMGKLRGRQGDEAGFVFFEQAIDLCRLGEPARRLEADVYCEYARFRAIMGDRDEARAYLERARELLEPFGDDAARERIDEDLQRLTQ